MNLALLFLNRSQKHHLPRENVHSKSDKTTKQKFSWIAVSQMFNLSFLDLGRTNNFKLFSVPSYQANNKQKLLSVKVLIKSEQNLPIGFPEELKTVNFFSG